MLTNNARAALFLVLLFLCGLQVLIAQPEVIDRIVAVVGKEPILMSDLNAQSEFYSFNNHVDLSTPGLKQQVLEALINEKLMLASALEDTTITVTEDEVTAQLDQLVAQRIQQAGSEKKVEELYGMPITKMKREFRDETRKRLLVQYLQQAKFGNIKPSRREVEEFFAQFKDSLPPVPEGADLYHIFKLPMVGESGKRVRPGITGWAQINQGYDTSVDDVRRKVRYDLEYIRRQSALEDLRIMARTLPVMMRRRGAW